MNTAPADVMTKGEREDLLRLVRQRERVCKAGAAHRSAELLAEFEAKISAIYSFDDDAVWKEAFEAAAAISREMQEKVAARCAELGIPKEFAPHIHLNWYGRGQSAFKERRNELRKKAKAEIDMVEKRARFAIEQASVVAQEKVLVAGLTSDAARAFLEQMPTAEALMPPLDMRNFTPLLSPPTEAADAVAC